MTRKEALWELIAIEKELDKMQALVERRDVLYKIVLAESLAARKPKRINSKYVETTVVKIIKEHAPIRPASIIELSNCSDSAVYRQLSLLVKKNLIHKNDKGEYTIAVHRED